MWPRRRPSVAPEASAPAACLRGAVVIDTNCVLELLVFDEPALLPLYGAVQRAELHWHATAAMRDELARVLGYPQVVRRLCAGGRSANEVLAAFDRWARPAPHPVATAVRCADVDDQVFIDLAVQLGATLFSKDGCVLALARRLAPLGVTVLGRWPAPGRAASE